MHAQNVDSNEIQISDLRDLAASLKHEYYTKGHMIYEYGKGKLSLLLLMLYLGHILPHVTLSSLYNFFDNLYNY